MVDVELAEQHNYSLNQEMIGQKTRLDGFYGIRTILEYKEPDIIRTTGGRSIIENCFCDKNIIMKVNARAILIFNKLSILFLISTLAFRKPFFPS